MSQLWQQREALTNRGIEVVAVTFEPAPQARAFLGKTEADWPLLIDEQQVLYRAYRMGKAGFWGVWGPKTWWAYLVQLLNGRLPSSSQGDIWQQGGDVLIDDHGIIRFHFIGGGPADRPTLQDIVEVFDQSAS